MILGISGRKQSGKNTTANIIHGMVLKDRGLVQDWNINADGTLMVDLSDGTGWGEFDVTRQDKQFSEWAENGAEDGELNFPAKIKSAFIDFDDETCSHYGTFVSWNDEKVY